MIFFGGGNVRNGGNEGDVRNVRNVGNVYNGGLRLRG